MPDLSTIPYLPYIIVALGGAVGGNILGALTRGGGGIVGRTVIGAIGGIALMFGAQYIPVGGEGGVTSYWGGLIAGDNGVHLQNLITGVIGGSILGLVGGLALRQR